jgi:hypothetical protein
VLEAHLLESPGTFSYAAVIIAERLDVPVREIAGPANPWNVRIVALGSEWANQQDAGDGIACSMENGVQFRSRNAEVAGLLKRICADNCSALTSMHGTLTEKAGGT